MIVIWWRCVIVLLALANGGWDETPLLLPPLGAPTEGWGFHGEAAWVCRRRAAYRLRKSLGWLCYAAAGRLNPAGPDWSEISGTHCGIRQDHYQKIEGLCEHEHECLCVCVCMCVCLYWPYFLTLFEIVCDCVCACFCARVCVCRQQMGGRRVTKLILNTSQSTNYWLITTGLLRLSVFVFVFSLMHTQLCTHTHTHSGTHTHQRFIWLCSYGSYTEN